MTSLSALPIELAQAASADSIGRVGNVTGTVFITRADGARVEVQTGTSLGPGDSHAPGAGAKLGIVFADDTTFAMGEKGKMVLDEMVYDPGSKVGKAAISVAGGLFSFVSGQIAKTGVDNMTITTPVAVIGIRGTAGAGSPNTFTMLADPVTGTVGEVSIRTQVGIQVMNQVFQAVHITSAFLPPPTPVVLPAAVVAKVFAAVTAALPSPTVAGAPAGVPGGPAAPVGPGVGIPGVPGAPGAPGVPGGPVVGPGGPVLGPGGPVPGGLVPGAPLTGDPLAAFAAGVAPGVPGGAPGIGPAGTALALAGQAAGAVLDLALARGSNIDQAFAAATATALSVSLVTPAAFAGAAPGAIGAGIANAVAQAISQTMGSALASAMAAEATTLAVTSFVQAGPGAGLPGAPGAAPAAGSLATQIADAVSGALGPGGAGAPGTFGPGAAAGPIGPGGVPGFAGGFGPATPGAFGPGAEGVGPGGPMNFTPELGFLPGFGPELGLGFGPGFGPEFGFGPGFGFGFGPGFGPEFGFDVPPVISLPGFGRLPPGTIPIGPIGAPPTTTINHSVTGTATVNLTAGAADIIIGTIAGESVTLVGVADFGDTFNAGGAGEAGDSLTLAAGANVIRVTNFSSLTINLPTTTSPQSIDWLGASSMTLQGGTSDPNAPFNLNVTTDPANPTATTNNLILAFAMGGSNAGSSNISLGDGTDSITLQGTVNTLNTLAGVETIHLSPASGGASLTLGTAVIGLSTVNGTGNNDTITVSSFAGTATFNGSGGDDTFNVNGATSGLTVDGGTGTADTVNIGSGVISVSLALVGVETVNGQATTNESLTITNAVTGITSLNLGTGTGDSLSLSAASGSTSIAGIQNVESVSGGAADNVLTYAAALQGDASSGSIDLGTGTDSITLANVANTASISNVETVNGGTGVDTLTISTAGTGGTTLAPGAGNDNLTLTTTGSVSLLYRGETGFDTIANFTAGGTDDRFVFDVSDYTGARTLLTTGSGAAGTANTAGGAATSFQTVAATGDFTTTAGNELFIFSAASFNSASAIQTAIQTGGGTVITFANANATGVFLAAYDTGTVTRIAEIAVSAAQTTAAATVTDVAELTGVSDVTTLTTDDFAFQA